MFNDIRYKQIEDLALGSLLGPTMTNAFLSFYELRWLKQCPNEFKSVFYRRYFDYIFFT